MANNINKVATETEGPYPIQSISHTTTYFLKPCSLNWYIWQTSVSCRYLPHGGTSTLVCMLDTCPIVCESDTSRRIRHVMRTWLLCLVLNNVQFILVAIIPSQLFVIFLVVTFP